ncbi:accessory gene regulator B family protein [Paenibacillus sp. HW567]|uniref:accessory gene regulator ArgB-like protein n=1 Tax=Paenibacillus sp. HW567 TaxID=1034769 RepID=UPI000377137F
MNIFSYKLAATIKRSNPQETSSIEIMQYALNIILNTLLIIITSLIIGWATGSLTDTAVSLFSFAVLRSFSGGLHLKTATACNIFSITLCTSIPHLSFLIKDHLWIYNAFSLFLMLLFAPNPDANVQISQRSYPLMKLIAVLLVATNFFIHSSVLGLAFLAQSLTVIPLERRK